MPKPTKKLGSSAIPIVSSYVPTDVSAALIAKNLPKKLPEVKNNKEYLKDQWATLSQRAMTWLMEGDRFEKMMEETRLKDLTIMLGIATEKVLLMEGQPTSIIGQVEHKKLEELLPALAEELKRRGAKAELTERKAVINLQSEYETNT